MKCFLPLIVLLGLFCACGSSDETPSSKLEDYPSSYALIQGEIWDVSCVSCHTAGTSFAKQSDLVLTAGNSYNQLINRTPNNQAAAADDLLLVGDKGLESLYSSFLWEKINAPDQDHFYSDHPEYGTLMPLGGQPLTNGQLEFIRKWIIAGAPQEGKVVDLAVLEDESRFENTEFEALDVPEKGYQFHVAPFDVAPNSDRELFIYQKLNNPEPIYIKSVEISMRQGSHHFILYNFPESFSPSLLPTENQLRDIYGPDGNENLFVLYHMQFHQFVVGTQYPKTHYTFPEGVALKVAANTGFDMNSHYANRTDEVVKGEVYANIHTVEATEVQHVAKVLNLNNLSISLPAGKKTTLTKTFKNNEAINVFQLWSHAHEHMTEFKVFISGGDRDGELIYISTDWEHPPILQLDPPVKLQAGQGLTLQTTYDNWEDHELNFGLKSSDEMMILFGAYY
jgi:hypothetical protein